MDDSKNLEILKLRQIVGQALEASMIRKTNSLLLDAFSSGITNENTVFPPSAKMVTPAFPQGLHIPTRGTV